jgi:phospholipase C
MSGCPQGRRTSAAPPEGDPTPPDRVTAMDHVVLVLFENRSFDNLLGRLYAPGEVPAFEGVIGKDLSNPIPEWAEHGREHRVVRYGVATSMDSPDPDPGEEYQHTNTQLFGTLDEANRYKDATEMVAPFNAPADGRAATMDGFVADYISFYTAEMGCQPTYDEYSQIMTGFTPEQVPVISGLAKGFGVFDHWFSEVPSQTMANRSFWTAATSSGYVVNRPMSNFMHHNDAETIFNRLEVHGKSWKVYVLEPDPVSFTGVIHMARLRDRFATHFRPFAEFERDAADGNLPHFSLIEPNLLAGHSDYHPAFGRALLPGFEVPIDPPSSILAGEAFLARIYNAVRSARSEVGSNVFNTALLIGFDEPGGTYDHVPPGAVPPPDVPPADSPAPGSAAPSSAASASATHDSGSADRDLGFGFDRSGYRVPAILVSPWVAEGSVFTDEYRHTSLIATLRAYWDLGAAFTGRDASARTFHQLFDLAEPRDPDSWPLVTARPVPAFQEERVAACLALSRLGKHLCHGLREHEQQRRGTAISPADDLDEEISPALALELVHGIAGRIFPRLRGAGRAAGASGAPAGR